MVDGVLKKKKSRNLGHRAGLNTVENIIKASIKNNNKFLNTYMPFQQKIGKDLKKKLKYIFKLLEEFLKKKIARIS